MIEYKNGYVAFIDILGFSKLVEKKENYNDSKNLFEFVDNICKFFNKSRLDVKLAFFSDTIIITSDLCNLVEIALTIRILESYLWENLKLVFRGSIVKGLYYNEKGIAFGPAIIKAYELEKKADTSRIIIDDDIINEKLIINDIDDTRILNLEYLTIYEKWSSRSKSTISFKEVFEAFKNRRNVINEMLLEYQNTSVAYKYEPKKYMFNFTINYICENREKNVCLFFNISEKVKLKSLIIDN